MVAACFGDRVLLSSEGTGPVHSVMKPAQAKRILGIDAVAVGALVGGLRDLCRGVTLAVRRGCPRWGFPVTVPQLGLGYWCWSRSLRICSSTAGSACGSLSTPIQRRPRRSAATRVVEQPQNGLSTKSPSFDEARAILS